MKFISYNSNVSVFMLETYAIFEVCVKDNVSKIPVQWIYRCINAVLKLFLTNQIAVKNSVNMLTF